MSHAIKYPSARAFYLVIDTVSRENRSALQWLLAIWADLRSKGSPVSLFLKHPSLKEEINRLAFGESLPASFLSDFPHFTHEDVLLIPDWEQAFLRESAHLYARRVCMATQWAETLGAMAEGLAGDFAPHEVICWSEALGAYLREQGKEVRIVTPCLPEPSPEKRGNVVVLFEGAGRWSPLVMKERLLAQGVSVVGRYEWVDVYEASDAHVNATELVIVPDAACPSPQAVKAMRRGCVVIAFHRKDAGGLLNMSREHANAFLIPWGDVCSMEKQVSNVLIGLEQGADLHAIKESIARDSKQMYPSEHYARDWVDHFLLDLESVKK